MTGRADDGMSAQQTCVWASREVHPFCEDELYVDLVATRFVGLVHSLTTDEWPHFLLARTNTLSLFTKRLSRSFE